MIKGETYAFCIFMDTQRLKTSTHKSKLQKFKSRPIQQSVTTTLKNVGGKEVFRQEFCETLIAANIPIKEL